MSTGQNRRAKLTEADLAAAEALTKLWARVKKERGMTQATIVDQWGEEITQAAISHFMNGRAALNFLAVMRFARILGVSPEEIRDDLPEQFELAHRPNAWPFRRITPKQWRELGEYGQGMAEAAVKREIIESQNATNTKPEIVGGNRRTLQRN